MAEQERRSMRSTTTPADARPVSRTATAERGEKLKKTLDEVLDEIDSVLEENAEEFVRSYVQRGGE